MILIEKYRCVPVADQKVEIVERKGRGHPDSICDAVMEAISVALSREYQRETGAILHHNIDKGLLAAGKVVKRFGGGEVLVPMELTIGDRATFRAGGREIPVTEIAMAAAVEWFRVNLRFVDPDRHLRCRFVLAPGSEELTDIFARPGQVLAANDTSASVGYYPLTPTELTVLELERHVNSGPFKEQFPWTGEDVKVMGFRNGAKLDITVAMPLMAGQVGSERDYFSRKRETEDAMRSFLRQQGRFPVIDLHYNSLDRRGRGLSGVYLSLLGTSAEDADSGQVGRGNRVNGVIALNRPLGTEAAAGKNPVSHVGKIYTFLAHHLARRIREEVPGVREAHVLLLSRIGTPVDRPRIAAAQLVPERGVRLGDLASPCREIIRRELDSIADFCAGLAAGRWPVC